MASPEDLRYLMQTMCWMGGHAAWPRDMVAEQLGHHDDQFVLADIDRAVDLGLLEQTTAGARLTDAGWDLARDD